MRSGGCTLQQTLTSEAASILKHSLGLARRRGHAQVTPLHVAATLLSLRASSLRTACLKSQSQHQYPLHSRALELCFNVALNRLPTTPACAAGVPPLLHNTTTLQQPSLSNALIAALKRAQAHQRRGCIEQQQQQPLLTIKVELEQLIISILDDPSVSRVMREAGFSSTAVKNNIEEDSSNTTNPSLFHCYNAAVFSSPSCYNPLLFSPPQKKQQPVYPISNIITTESQSQSQYPSSKEDIKLVLDVLLRKKKRNTVIVGDSVSLTEGLVGELMGRFERGEVPDELKSTQFIKYQLAPVVSLRFMKRNEVEMNLLQLKRKVEETVIGGGGRGAVFYVGDLKWVVDDAAAIASLNEKEVVYNPVEHIVAEIAKLFCEQKGKVWLVATASYQTYMRCQMRQPPLETQWGLQAVPVPSGGLGLTLHASSVHDSKMTISLNPSPIMESKLFSNKEEQDNLNCCEECASNYEKEAQLFKPGQKKLLPSWLQSHSTEAHQKEELTQLKKKWNRLCNCLHQNKQPQNSWSNTLHGNQHSSNSAKIYPYNSSYPWWPTHDSTSSISFADSVAKPAYSSSNNVPRFRRQQSCTTIEFNFNDVTQKKQQTPATTTLDSLKGMETTEGKEVKITLALGNSTFGGSGQKTVEKNITTLVPAHICKLLQENVPWQSETVASIAEALLVDSKSAKKESATTPTTSPTWLLLQGNDSIGKTRLALAIAESVFGSVDVLLHLDMLKKENSETPFAEMLSGVLKSHEKFVLLVENVDFADTQFRKLLADGFETAKFGTLSGKNENSGEAIFILTNGGTKISDEDQKNKESLMRLVLQISETKPTLDSSSSSSYSSSPCLGHKRRAELELFTKIKNPRIEEKEEGVLVSEQRCKKKEFSRQSSFNTLDLNMKADEEEYDGANSPISSDLTRETMVDVDTIENRFELNQSEAKEKEKEEVFMSRIKESFEEVFGKQCVGKFTVEERVIEEIGGGCGSFTNSMFEKWLKDIFQRSLLQTVSSGGKEGIVFTLCWGGKEDKNWDSGFMGSCLPKNVQVNYFMD